MFARTRFTALMGVLLLIPLMTACEGYEQPGEEEAQLETQQEEARPGQEQQARPGQEQQRQEEMETRQQRREAETEGGERPERPEPPARTEETGEEAGEEAEEGEMTERMSMTEFSVQVPQDLSSGSYTLSCPVPEDARRQQSGQEQGQQPTRDDVQLEITVRQSGQESSINR